VQRARAHRSAWRRRRRLPRAQRAQQARAAHARGPRLLRRRAAARRPLRIALLTRRRRVQAAPPVRRAAGAGRVRVLRAARTGAGALVRKARQRRGWRQRHAHPAHGRARRPSCRRSPPAASRASRGAATSASLCAAQRPLPLPGSHSAARARAPGRCHRYAPHSPACRPAHRDCGPRQRAGPGPHRRGRMNPRSLVLYSTLASSCGLSRRGAPSQLPPAPAPPAPAGAAPSNGCTLASSDSS